VLTDAQKVRLGELLEPDIADRAEKRMAEAGTKSSPGKPATYVAGFGQPKRTVDETARTVGIGSGRTYERQKAVIDQLKEEDDGDHFVITDTNNRCH